MKRALLTAALVLLAAMGVKAQVFKSDTWQTQVEKDSSVVKFIDLAGNTVLRMENMDAAASFAGGVCWVMDSEGRFGVINEAGKYIANPAFIEVEGTVKNNFLTNGSNKDERAEYFKKIKNALIPVKVSTKWGYANYKGKLVVKPQFEYAYEFDSAATYSLVAVRDRQGVLCLGVVNRKGRYIIDPTPLASDMLVYSKEPKTDANLLPQRQGDLWGYVDKRGNVTIKPRFMEAGMFIGGMAPVKIDSSWVYINARGEEILRLAKLRSVGISNYVIKAFPFDESGKAAVLMGDKPLVEKTKDTIVLEADTATRLVADISPRPEHNRSKAKRNSTVKYGYIDRAGRQVGGHQFYTYWLPDFSDFSNSQQGYHVAIMEYDKEVMLYVSLRAKSEDQRRWVEN